MGVEKVEFGKYGGWVKAANIWKIQEQISPRQLDIKMVWRGLDYV